MENWPEDCSWNQNFIVECNLNPICTLSIKNWVKFKCLYRVHGLSDFYGILHVWTNNNMCTKFQATEQSQVLDMEIWIEVKNNLLNMEMYASSLGLQQWHHDVASSPECYCRVARAYFSYSLLGNIVIYQSYSNHQISHLQ